MLCDECNENQAQITYTTIQDNQVKEVHLCHECMHKHFSQELQIPFFQDPSMGGFMEQIFSLFASQGGQETVEISCPYCSHTLNEFQKTSLLGCQHCYESFKEELEKIIPRLQGSSQHVGYVPENFEDRKKQARSQEDRIQETLEPQSLEKIEELKNRLKEAIDQERYEEAALLRDQIKELEEGGKHGGANPID